MTVHTESCLPPRVLFVDLENCPAHLPTIKDEIASYQKVLVCYAGNGTNEPRIPISIAVDLAEGIHLGRVEFFGMKRSGKNAADFAIAFWAGRLVMEMPPNTEFVIASADGGLDHVVDLLLRAGRRATRVVTPPQTKGPSTLHPDDAAEEFFEALLLHPQIVPRRQATLLNSIQSYFKSQKKTVAPQAILDSLMASGLITINTTKRIVYAKIDRERDELPLIEENLPNQECESSPAEDEVPL